MKYPCAGRYTAKFYTVTFMRAEFKRDCPWRSVCIPIITYNFYNSVCIRSVSHKKLLLLQSVHWDLIKNLYKQNKLILTFPEMQKTKIYNFNYNKIRISYQWYACKRTLAHFPCSTMPLNKLNFKLLLILSCKNIW